MKHRIQQLLIALLLLQSTVMGATVLSFENASDMTAWTVQNGTIAQSGTNVKLGEKALCWNWSANSILSVTNPSNLSAASNSSSGGIHLWVYNTAASDKKITFQFYNNASYQGKIDFNLNFTGWRCLLARFKRDMGTSGTVNTMKVVAPSSSTGTLYFDYLEFQNSVTWTANSDAQYEIEDNPSLVNHLAVRNTPVLPAKTPNEAEKTSFKTISDRLDLWLLGSNKYIADATFKQRYLALYGWINAGVYYAPKISANGNVENTKSGLFPIDYYGKTIDGVKVETFRYWNERSLLQLAYDYKVNGKEASLTKIKEIYQWYHDQGWADGSGLGSIRMEFLRSAGYTMSAMLLRNDLGEQHDNVTSAMRWFSIAGNIYDTPEYKGENSDVIRLLMLPQLCYALTIKDEAARNTALHGFKQYAENAFAEAPGWSDCFKSDGSGYHHRGAYFSAYYPQALHAASLIYFLLSDTEYALDESIFETLKNGVLSYRFLSDKYDVPVSVCGRFPYQTQTAPVLLSVASYLLATSDGANDTELLGVFKRLWDTDASEVKSFVKNLDLMALQVTYGEVELMLDAAARAGKAEQSPVGIKYMPYSGLFIARQDNWMLTAKGYSKYIWDYEAGSSENIYGRYLSHGMLEFTDLTNANKGCNPMSNNSGWDWCKLPGTTVKKLSESSLSYAGGGNNHRNFSDEAFLGGLSLTDEYGMFTVKLHDIIYDRGFRANKSTFVFGDLIYCMGSNITQGSASVELHTNLFQNTKGSTPITVNGSSVTAATTLKANDCLKDNYGNVFIADQPVQLTFADKYVSGYINHGKTVGPAAYNYTWLMKPTQATIDKVSSSNPIQVLLQSDKGHVAYHKEAKVLAASLFKAGAQSGVRDILQVSKPMLIMMKELEDGSREVAFSDPDMNRPIGSFPDRMDDLSSVAVSTPGAKTSISFTIQGQYIKGEGTTAGVVVTVEGDNSIVTYPSAKDGETCHVELLPVEAGIESTAKQALQAYAYEQLLHIDNPENLPLTCMLYTVNGESVLQQHLSRTTTINLQHLPKGIYLLTMQSEGEFVSQKIKL